MSHHLGDLIRITVQPGITAVRSRRGLHTQQGSRSHLTAGHTVNRIVNINRYDVLASSSRMNRLTRTDSRHIAVTLIGEDQTVRMQALCRSSYGTSTAVSRLNPIHIDIIIRENRTTDRRNSNRFSFHAHLIDHLGNQFMNRTVTATRAVVHHVLRDQLRLGIHQVLLFDFYYFCHILTFY